MALLRPARLCAFCAPVPFLSLSLRLSIRCATFLYAAVPSLFASIFCFIFLYAAVPFLFASIFCAIFLYAAVAFLFASIFLYAAVAFLFFIYPLLHLLVRGSGLVTFFCFFNGFSTSRALVCPLSSSMSKSTVAWQLLLGSSRAKRWLLPGRAWAGAVC